MNNDLRELRRIAERNEALPGEHAAYRAIQVTLDPGEMAVITLHPVSGRKLKVTELAFTDRESVDYSFIVDGTQFSENHRVVFDPYRTVHGDGSVVAEALNESGSSATLDFEMHARSAPVE